MACTHWHSPRAAPDTLPTLSALKSGRSVNFLILDSSASISWSLSNSSSLSKKLASPSCFLASSQVGDFLSTVMTPLRHSSTSAGGLAYALSSDMSFLVSTLSAASASASAGIALSSPAWHSKAMALASSASLPILVASAVTSFSCSSATRLSCTMVTSSSSQSFLACATTIFFSLATICIAPTCTSVSPSLSSPPRSLVALPPICLRFSASSER
mmetsp:Transcript_4552/g.11467  ORF Transcript_4552/g.11467 Transcript_4552/m.11467 type:complete len:215 (-) Transcript_4552:241-885(-)